jgi:hypothetical protein
VRIGALAELENGPAPVGRDPPQLPVGVDDDRMADGFEEREVGVAVGVRRALREVEALALGDGPQAIGLGPRMQRAQRPAGEAAVSRSRWRATRRSGSA